jgi:nicotinamidase/pyrazinamidase
MSKILVVVDMQNDFVEGALGTKEAATIVPKVVSKIRNHDGIVVYTQDTHQPEYLSTQEGKHLPVLHCIENTDGWQIVNEVKALADKDRSRIITKDTFGSKGLIEYLIELDKTETISEIQLIGLCTDICVISNALAIKAYFPEVPIVVDEACCAGVTPESHKNAINAMKVCQIEIINS